MKQITIDLSLEEIPSEVLPRQLIEKASVIRFLRIDLDGYLITSHIAKDKVDETVTILRENCPHIKIVRGGPAQDSSEILRVSGGWWRKLDNNHDSKHKEVFEMFKALSRSQCYLLRSPEIVGKNFRFTWVGDTNAIKQLHAIFTKIGVKYRVSKLLGNVGSGDSPMDLLTPQQMRVVRLAHAFGYYDVPRKARTQQLARMLKMDKGTVGEHLRRAEKRLMNSLLS